MTVKKGIDRQMTLKMARTLPSTETVELETDLSLQDLLTLWKERLEDYSKDEALEAWEREKAAYQLKVLKDVFDDILSYSPKIITEVLEEEYSKDVDWALYRWALLQIAADKGR